MSDPECRTAVNWVNKTIRRMTQKRALKQWETKVENYDITLQAIWPIAKFLTKRGGPKVPTAIRGHLDLAFYPIEKSNLLANCLETCSRRTKCVTVTMNGGWRLESKLC
jgi:hypothetical protein